jgi:hypothetical protein
MKDPMEVLIEKLKTRLEEVKTTDTWDEWNDGVKFGREDMIKKIIMFIEKLSEDNPK